MVGKAELDVPAIDTSSHCSSASSLLHVRVFAWATFLVLPPVFAAALPPLCTVMGRSGRGRPPQRAHPRFSAGGPTPAGRPEGGSPGPRRVARGRSAVGA